MRIRVAFVLLLWAALVEGLAAAAAGEVAMTERHALRIANVREFGAVGDGKTDDTAAIEKAWAFVMDGSKPQFQNNWTPSVNVVLYFPQGIYRYAGGGLQAGGGVQTWELRGDGMNATRIDIAPEVYFLTVGRVQSTVVRDLSFFGGKGAFRSTYASNMVGGKHIFNNCYFFDYSECAIGNNADDSPYLTVYDCIFHCRKGADAIGIAWGGYVDDSQITRCAFERNAYHVKIGDRLSGSFQIGPRNSFISFGGTKTKADVWIVPNAEGGRGINSGQGSLISDNKFGNENVDLAAPRILVAAEDRSGGADRLASRPAEAPGGLGLAVTGWRIRGNLFLAKQNMQRGVVFSRVPHTALIFEHNYFNGGPHPYLIEFDPRIGRLPDRTPGNCTYVYPQERDNVERDLFPTELCNLPGYAVTLDPYGNFAGAAEAPAAWGQPADPGYLPLLARTGKEMPVAGNAVVAAVADARGEPVAAEVRLADGAGGLAVRIDEAQVPAEGRTLFLDVELKAAPERSLDRVALLVLNRHAAVDASGPAFLGDKTLLSQRVFSRTVKLQPYWQRITLPLVIRDARDAEFVLAIRPYGYDPREFIKGEKERFWCGNVRVYHAVSPDNGERKGARTAQDCDVTLRAGVDPEQLLVTGTLTAARTVTLAQAEGAVRPLSGAKFRISRSAGGEAPLQIGTLATLRAGEWCEVLFTGGDFHLVARGTLSSLPS